MVPSARGPPGRRERMEEGGASIERVHRVLQTLNVDRSFRTFGRGKETGWVWWH